MAARCVVEAPDAFAAFLLARQLELLGADADVEPHGRGCSVAVEATTEDDLAQLLRLVQTWMADERIDETTVRFGERAELLRVA